MNKIIIFALGLILAAIPQLVSATTGLKLPYQRGQAFVVVQGYHSPPTHIDKDANAVDFSQNGCDAYGKLTVASAAGVVVLAKEDGYNGGYGTQVLIDEGDHVIARYAHLIPGTIPFGVGATVVQGQLIGAIGNTGLVAGNACPIHPGTHLHFAMYYQVDSGNFLALVPEPISGYTNITAGRWYLSDNDIAGASDQSSLNADISDVNEEQSESADAAPISVAPSPPVTPTPVMLSIPVEASSVAPLTLATTVTPFIKPLPTSTGPVGSVVASVNTSGGGGEGGVDSEVAAATTQIVVTTTTATTTTDIADAAPTTTPPTTTTTIMTTPVAVASTSFNSTTLAIDMSWQAVTSSSTPVVYEIDKVDPTNASNTIMIATTTDANYSYQLGPTDFSVVNYFAINIWLDSSTTVFSTVATASTSIPDWYSIIQPIDTDGSTGSWYDDNWYDLGTDFYGLLRSLTVEGEVDSSSYLKSHLYLQEYLDPNYTQLSQTWTISNDAPFTNEFQKITIGNISIPLQPDKYYRLITYQDYQNVSVILMGTAATGTAMWDEFRYGDGKVQIPYTFYPYFAAVIIPY